MAHNIFLNITSIELDEILIVPYESASNADLFECLVFEKYGVLKNG